MQYRLLMICLAASLFGLQAHAQGGSKPDCDEPAESAWRSQHESDRKVCWFDDKILNNTDPSCEAVLSALKNEQKQLSDLRQRVADRLKQIQLKTSVNADQGAQCAVVELENKLVHFHYDALMKVLNSSSHVALSQALSQPTIVRLQQTISKSAKSQLGFVTWKHLMCWNKNNKVGPNGWETQEAELDLLDDSSHEAYETNSCKFSFLELMKN